MNLTPLIDVLFILIIFFTVSSTWRERPGLDLDLPTAGSATVENATEVTVSVSADGSLFIDGEAVAANQVTAELSRRLAGEERLIIEADRSAPHGVIVTILDAARSQGARKVVFATQSGR